MLMKTAYFATFIEKTALYRGGSETHWYADNVQNKVRYHQMLSGLKIYEPLLGI